MGLIGKTREAESGAIYETAKKLLHEKDGNVHIVMFNSFSQLANQTFTCETKYTIQIGGIIDAMQEDGYEIVDIKFNSLPNQGLTQQLEGFNTLIMYK